MNHKHLFHLHHNLVIKFYNNNQYMASKFIQSELNHLYPHYNKGCTQCNLIEWHNSIQNLITTNSATQ